MSNRWDIRWKDYYQILQVHPTAGQEVIKSAYDWLARVYHPDVNQEPSSNQKMKDINEAFEVLGTLETRRLYHPEWLQKRRESNNRQAPPRTSIHRETDEGTETPVRPIGSKSRIPAWGKWAIGLAVIYLVISFLIMIIPKTNPPSASVRLPTASVRLTTGTYLVKNLVGGLGELKIDNGLDLDAVALLSRPEQSVIPLMAVYIRAGASHTIRGITDGVYMLYFSFGEDWDDESKKFMGKPIYQRFKDKFNFSTTSDQYTTWEVTLNPVIGGTADTEYLAEDRYPELVPVVPTPAPAPATSGETWAERKRRELGIK